MWSEEEEEKLEQCWDAYAHEDEAKRCRLLATRAVELKAARGGTMTAERLERMRRNYFKATSADFEALFNAFDALGARNAVLEEDVSRWQENVETVRGERDTERDLRKAIRRRSLEAGSLERLIAEHGLPAAMRWLVEGETPARCRCSAASERTNVLHMPGCPLFRDRCSPICTHPDAATPGHPERVKERSEAFNDLAASVKVRNGMSTDEARAFDAGVDSGAEAMRAACLSDVTEWARRNGYLNEYQLTCLKGVIEGATP